MSSFPKIDYDDTTIDFNRDKEQYSTLTQLERNKLVAAPSNFTFPDNSLN
ncbi:hypothetical protein HMPREF1991_03139 [Hoylesella loescheii DSM 19665 = JCM 12249 = ATCC 15930]|uniref:Uncharacterized protein n=1 Tax=Hoylesella loescheii DSM 19665 = JCM 12249 = ATCC 15930 TaxID=1122985 RepID=A0A069QDU2_HOYLO|nr:hypothetical protein HMPREF1991_03139 [Hoylesella loescheii DSM 19665 = JCM 12249 = ATCC 15930]